MITVGLTGSIGMGKSTTAGLFADEGIPVCDSDAMVHDLYAGEAVAPLAAIFPTVLDDGKINRDKLSRLLRENPAQFPVVERIVHPLVRAKQEAFIERHRRENASVVVLDIPLLYETRAESRVDVVVVVSCDADLQKQRVLARPGMTEDKFAMILERQMPDAEKRKRADFIIDTGHGIENARDQVRAILSALTTKQ